MFILFDLEFSPECFGLARVAFFEEFACRWIYQYLVVTISLHYKLVASYERHYNALCAFGHI